MQLNEKVAVITGAASGMGAATAEMLAQHGVRVALLDVNLEKAEQQAKKCGGIALSCDVSNTDSAEKAIKAVVDHYGAIHFNINCAGICPAGRVVGREGPMPLDDFNKVIQINLIGTFNILRLCAAQMLKQDIGVDSTIKTCAEVGAGSKQDAGAESNNNANTLLRGVIINTASVAAYEGQIGQSAYSASKGAVASMTLPIARELGKFGVRIMTIAPGIIKTPMMAGLPDHVQQALAENVVCPKRLGQPQEYASLVKHIIENDYLNGSVIRLDGAIRMTPK